MPHVPGRAMTLQVEPGGNVPLAACPPVARRPWVLSPVIDAARARAGDDFASRTQRKRATGGLSASANPRETVSWRLGLCPLLHRCPDARGDGCSGFALADEPP